MFFLRDYALPVTLTFDVRMNNALRAAVITWSKQLPANFHPIVSGRYQTVNRSKRTCNLCDAGVIGNEFHYIFKCKAFYLERKLYIPNILRNMPSIIIGNAQFLIVGMLKYC